MTQEFDFVRSSVVWKDGADIRYLIMVNTRAAHMLAWLRQLSGLDDIHANEVLHAPPIPGGQVYNHSLLCI